MSTVSRPRSPLATATVVVVAIFMALACVAPTASAQVPETFFDFVLYGCPAGLIAPGQKPIVDQIASRYCCTFYPSGSSKKGKRYCGSDLLGVQGAGTFQCSASMLGMGIDCCTVQHANQSISNDGMYCAIQGTSSMVSAAVLVVALAVVMVVSAL